MTEQRQIYKCRICGNIVEVLHSGKGELVCCGEPMILLRENSVDAAQEKHIPVVERMERGMKVKVGEVPHPMEDAHHIEWIELITGGGVYRQFLAPGDPPEASFDVPAKKTAARAYCNLHGLWKGGENQ